MRKLPQLGRSVHNCASKIANFEAYARLSRHSPQFARENCRKELFSAT
jgi:hypothetical protein